MINKLYKTLFLIYTLFLIIGSGMVIYLQQKGLLLAMIVLIILLSIVVYSALDIVFKNNKYM